MAEPATRSLAGYVTRGTLVVDGGTHLVLDVRNRGGQTHDLKSESGTGTGKVGPGESQRLDLGVVSERFAMVCTQSFHELIGMKLRIQVAP